MAKLKGLGQIKGAGQTKGDAPLVFSITPVNHPSESAGVRPDGKDRCLEEANGMPAGNAGEECQREIRQAAAEK